MRTAKHLKNTPIQRITTTATVAAAAAFSQRRNDEHNTTHGVHTLSGAKQRSQLCEMNLLPNCIHYILFLYKGNKCFFFVA